MVPSSDWTVDSLGCLGIFAGPTDVIPCDIQYDVSDSLSNNAIGNGKSGNSGGKADTVVNKGYP